MSTLMVEVDVEPQAETTDDPSSHRTLEPNSEAAEITKETGEDNGQLAPTLEEAPVKETEIEENVPLTPLSPVPATPGYTSKLCVDICLSSIEVL